MAFSGIFPDVGRNGRRLQAPVVIVGCISAAWHLAMCGVRGLL